MKYSVITFGCRVNQSDSLGFEEQLLADGAEAVELAGAMAVGGADEGDVDVLGDARAVAEPAAEGVRCWALQSVRSPLCEVVGVTAEVAARCSRWLRYPKRTVGTRKKP